MTIFAKFSRNFALVLAALVGVCCRRPDSQVTPQNERTIAMAMPTLQGLKAKSFSYPFASSLRDSHVPVARRRYAALERWPITYCEPSRPTPERQAPLTLVVSPDARHLVLSYASGNDLIEVGRCAALGPPGDPLALDDVAVLGGAAFTWALARSEQNNVTMPGLARRIEGPRYASVGAVPTAFPGGGQPPSVYFEGGQRFARYGTEWTRNLRGHSGVAAIGGDFSVVVALDDGSLQIYLPQGDPQKLALLAAQRNVGQKADWLSIVGPRIALVSRAGSGSKLSYFDADAAPAFALGVAFEASQPVIAGAGSRSYLVGKGLAAVDDGKLSWSQSFEQTAYASSFEDGSLAVAVGKRVDFVKPDGSVDQSFTTEEPLLAPPAIAGDGSVWLASTTAIYWAH